MRCCWARSEARNGRIRARKCVLNKACSPCAKALGLYANLRPVRPHPATLGAAPIKPHLLSGVDLLVVRELTGGIYFGDKTRDADSASDLCNYSVGEVERVVRRACELARQRRGHVTSVDKANVLETSRLWREVATRVARDEFPDIVLEHQLVDSMAMHLLSKPRAFDVVVTENMFGDILTDEASMLAGSMGLLPSASLGDGRVGLYEPIHGSAPDIAGRGIANPCGAILSVAMLLRHSLGLALEADCVEQAVSATLDAGVLTADLTPAGAASTAQVTAAVLEHISADCHVAEFATDLSHCGAALCRALLPLQRKDLDEDERRGSNRSPPNPPLEGRAKASAQRSVDFRQCSRARVQFRRLRARSTAPAPY